MARVGFIHFYPPEDNDSDSAASLYHRVEFLPKVAREMGIETVTVSAEQILEPDPNPLLDNLLRRLDHCWWFGRVAGFEESVALCRAFERRTGGEGVLFEAPEIVEQSHSLGLFYPLLEKLDLPQPKTLLVPLRDADMEGDEKAVRARLKALLPRKISDKGVFLRTYYGTRKINPGANVARDYKEMIDVCWNYVDYFGDKRSLGGIGIRELLDIQYVWDSKEKYCIPREFRAFVLDGEPIYWIGHLPLEEMRYKVSEEDFEKVGPGNLVQRMGEIARRAAPCIDSKFFVVDFAILQNGQLSLIEINPAYCAGWAHRSSLVCVYGPLLNYLTDAQAWTQDQLLDLCERLGISLWGLDIICGFFD